MSPNTEFRIGIGITRTKPAPEELIPDEVQDIAGGFKYSLADKSRQFVYMKTRKEWRETTKPSPNDREPDFDRSRQWPNLAAQLPHVDATDLAQDALQFRDACTRYTSRSTGKRYLYNYTLSLWEETDHL